jgi:hypothetical protein
VSELRDCLEEHVNILRMVHVDIIEIADLFNVPKGIRGLYLLEKALCIFRSFCLVDVSETVADLAFVEVDEVEHAHVPEFVHDIPVTVFGDNDFVKVNFL